jgi:hypothetical protein
VKTINNNENTPVRAREAQPAPITIERDDCAELIIALRPRRGERADPFPPSLPQSRVLVPLDNPLLDQLEKGMAFPFIVPSVVQLIALRAGAESRQKGAIGTSKPQTEGILRHRNSVSELL